MKATFANRADRPTIVRAALNRVKRDGLPLVPSFELLKMFKDNESLFIIAEKIYWGNKNR